SLGVLRRRDSLPARDHGFVLRHSLGRVEPLAAFDQLFFRSDVARLNAGAEFLEKEPHLRQCLRNRRKQKLHESSSVRRRHCTSIPVCLWAILLSTKAAGKMRNDRCSWQFSLRRQG